MGLSMGLTTSMNDAAARSLLVGAALLGSRRSSTSIFITQSMLLPSINALLGCKLLRLCNSTCLLDYSIFLDSTVEILCP